jgi:hypothetical protein
MDVDPISHSIDLLDWIHGIKLISGPISVSSSPSEAAELGMRLTRRPRSKSIFGSVFVVCVIQDRDWASVRGIVDRYCGEISIGLFCFQQSAELSAKASLQTQIPTEYCNRGTHLLQVRQTCLCYPSGNFSTGPR